MRNNQLKGTFLLFTVFSLALGFAQPKGKVIETKMVKSSILGKEVAYTVFCLQIMKVLSETILLFISYMDILTTIPAGYNLGK